MNSDLKINQIKSSIHHKEGNDRNQEYKHLITRPKQTIEKPTNIISYGNTLPKKKKTKGIHIGQR